jgi:hypothetical protein
MPEWPGRCPGVTYPGHRLTAVSPEMAASTGWATLALCLHLLPAP